MSVRRHAVDGIVVLDKAFGTSSNQALQYVKKLFSAKKAGHSGSLDVLATGLLPVCLGQSTKFSQFLLDSDKYYCVIAKLGERTTTCDAEGEVIEKKPVPNLTKDKLEKILEQFRGEITQIPSMYSALKHKGVPLYRLARQGIEVERQPRKIHIYELILKEYTKNTLTLEVSCSKGTYIRNLVDDIGQALDCCAYVTNLRRLRAGPFKEDEMITIEQIKEAKDPLVYLKPIDAGLIQFSSITLDEQETSHIRMGQVFKVKTTLTGLVRLKDNHANFIGMGKLDLNGLLKAKRLLA